MNICHGLNPVASPEVVKLVHVLWERRNLPCCLCRAESHQGWAARGCKDHTGTESCCKWEVQIPVSMPRSVSTVVTSTWCVSVFPWSFCPAKYAFPFIPGELPRLSQVCILTWKKGFVLLVQPWLAENLMSVPKSYALHHNLSPLLRASPHEGQAWLHRIAESSI